VDSKSFPELVVSGSVTELVLAGPNAWAFVTSSGQLGLISNIPEPATWVLLIAGLLASSHVRKRRHLLSPARK
jgi:PEP-CTERM motif